MEIISMSFINSETGKKVMDIDVEKAIETSKNTPDWFGSDATICGFCEFSDDNTYSSDPPQIKCTKTGRFHPIYEKCSIEEENKNGKEIV